MSKPIPEPKAGDPCPSCGGALVAQRTPSDAEYARAVDRENPIPLPPGTDTAAPEVRAERGALHRCATCGYQTRIPAAPEPAPAEAVDTPA